MILASSQVKILLSQSDNQKNPSIPKKYQLELYFERQKIQFFVQNRMVNPHREQANKDISQLAGHRERCQNHYTKLLRLHPHSRLKSQFGYLSDRLIHA